MQMLDQLEVSNMMLANDRSVLWSQYLLPVKVYRLHNLCVDEGEEPAAVVKLLLRPGAGGGGYVIVVPVVIPAGVHVQLPAPITGQYGVLTNHRSVLSLDQSKVSIESLDQSKVSITVDYQIGSLTCYGLWCYE